MLWFWPKTTRSMAYQEGFEAGYLGTSNYNPYNTSSRESLDWEEGWSDGISFYTSPTYTENFRREDEA